jgi:hypothetical protein
VREAEYSRKFRVLDQMLSSHATLAARYRRRANTLVLVVMALSIVAATFALQSEGDLQILGISLQTKVWLAILAGLIFFLSIVELVVDWRGRAWGHRHAIARLGALKAQFRRAEVDDGVVDGKGVDLDAAYDEAMAGIVEIPNAAFNRLKAQHRRKVAVSQLLEDYPGSPVIYLRWRVLREDMERMRIPASGQGVLEESPPGEEPGSDESDEARSTG